MKIVSNKKITDYIPELKEFEKNGLILDSASGDNTQTSFLFKKRTEDKCLVSICITIFFEEGETYSKEYILELLRLNLKEYYNE